jgi:septal ring factor EnvC (AmiA/AmiB activator)
LQQENVELCCQLRRHALGFDAMATLVDYLANHCGVVGVMEFNKQLKQDIANLQITVEDKKEEIATLTKAVSEQETSINQDNEKESASQIEVEKKIMEIEAGSKAIIKKLEHTN